MTSSTKDSSSNGAPDFEQLLLNEYSYISGCFVDNEELGERRVQLYISLSTAILTALAAIGGGIPFLGVEADPKLFLIGSIVLLLFGIVTLNRIINRNIVTDRYCRNLDVIRRYFVSPGDERIQYLPFNPYGKPKARRIDKGWNPLFSLRKGGLLETVVLWNSLIFAAFAISLSVLAFSKTGTILQIASYGLIGLLVFVTGWASQVIYARKKYDEECEKLQKEASSTN